MGRQRTRVDASDLPTAGFATNAKGPGLTQIFFDDDALPNQRTIPHRPSGPPTSVSSLLAMLPAVSGSGGDVDASPGGRKHIKPHQAHDFGRLLQHYEHEGPKAKAEEGGKYIGTRSRSRKHTNAAAAQVTSAEIGRHARAARGKSVGHSANKVTSRDAAMMLPPIHGRPQLYNGSPARQHPDWSVKVDRKPFRPL